MHVQAHPDPHRRFEAVIEVPPFPVLATTPGMTAIALTAALLTSHRLQPDERER